MAKLEQVLVNGQSLPLGGGLEGRVASAIDRSGAGSCVVVQVAVDQQSYSFAFPSGCAGGGDGGRERTDQLSHSLDRLRFRQRTTSRLTTERDRMLALASDFRARARETSGAALRELLRPWIEGGIVDKDKRTLTLTIRRVPNAGPFLLLSPMPGPAFGKRSTICHRRAGGRRCVEGTLESPLGARSAP